MKVFVISQITKLNSEKGYPPYGQSIVTEILSETSILCFRHEALYGTCCLINKLYHITNKKEWRKCEYEEEKV